MIREYFGVCLGIERGSEQGGPIEAGERGATSLRVSAR